MAERISEETLIEARRRMYHNVMACLHRCFQRSGRTYEQVAAMIGWPVKRVQRAMWDEKFWQSNGSIGDMALIACANGCEIEFTLQRRDDAPPTDHPAPQPAAQTET